MGYRATLYRNIAIPQPLYLVMGYSTFSLLYLIFFQKWSGFNHFFRLYLTAPLPRVQSTRLQYHIVLSPVLG
jgi:hypothetical protein